MQVSNVAFFIVTIVAAQGVLPGVAARAGEPDRVILKTAEKYREAVLAGDAAAVATTYREDAVEMIPGRPLLKGRPAIEQYYRELFQGPKISSFTFSYLETKAAGDTGYVIGRYQRKLSNGPAGPGPIEDSGNFVVIVKRSGGSWSSAYLIYNSDHLPSTQCAASLVVPFPQHELAILTSRYVNVAFRWLLEVGILALAVIPIVAILLMARPSEHLRENFLLWLRLG